MSKQRIFIGSSKTSLKVANPIARRLERDGCGQVTIWDEGVFSLNQAFLDRLVKALTEFDYAILIWAPDDLTESKGESSFSPRDNVIFECGLFMGTMGKNRVSVVGDDSVPVKKPFRFRRHHDSQLRRLPINEKDEAAVRAACDSIGKVILRPKFAEIEGEWTSRYALSAVPGHGEMIDSVQINAARGGISISKCDAADDPYCSYGMVVDDNQIMGQWKAAHRAPS